MRNYLKFYIDGRWVDPEVLTTLDVIDPTSEKVAGRIALGGTGDVDKAVRAARGAFEKFSNTTRQERIALLERIIAETERRGKDMANAIDEEMGAPPAFAELFQLSAGLNQLRSAPRLLKDFKFEDDRGSTLIVKEPIGVCAFITPWNWPFNQIAAKVGPAIATGCTMVLKPSEVAPFSGQIFAEIMHAAGVPSGVFNLVHGDGPVVGVALSAHPEVDMISFTGSTRAGIEVGRNAAVTIKRVHQELGGKSPYIVLDDDMLAKNVVRGVRLMMLNSGQSCNAPSRMLVPAKRMDEAIAAAKSAYARLTISDPRDNFSLGPLASEAQWNKVEGLIHKGVAEGATLVIGGLGKPEEFRTGYYVKPTLFAGVTNDMTIAREEIFGPVLCILSYDNIDQAVEIGNDTVYGLAAYINGVDLVQARAIGRRMRAGQVNINGMMDYCAPFGGYKMSGNGRELSDYAFHEFLETKAMTGYAPERAAG